MSVACCCVLLLERWLTLLACGCVQAYNDRGALVPDEIVMDMVGAACASRIGQHVARRIDGIDAK